jgi:alkyl sulfatase BDS1-like metallo-beta-lactamase superfamily hydrolase
VGGLPIHVNVVKTISGYLAKSLILVQSGGIKFDGDINAFVSILQMLEEFPFWFNIVTP